MTKETIMNKRFQEVFCNEVNGLYLSDYWFDLNKVSITDFDPSCMRYVAIINENRGEYTLKISEDTSSLYRFDDLRIIFTKDKNVLSLTSKNNSLYLSDVSISTEFTNMDEIQKRYNEDIVINVHTYYNSSSKLLSEFVREFARYKNENKLLTENCGSLTMIIHTIQLPTTTLEFPATTMMVPNYYHPLPIFDTKHDTIIIKDIFLHNSDEDDELPTIHISLTNDIYNNIVVFIKQWLKYNTLAIDNEDIFRFKVDGMSAIQYDIGAGKNIYFIEPEKGLLVVAIIDNNKLLFATMLDEKRIQELLHSNPDEFNKYSYIQY